MRVCNAPAGWRSAAAAPRRHVITARGGDRRGGGGGGAGTQRFTPPERLLSAAPGSEQVRSRNKLSLAALACLALDCLQTCSAGLPAAAPPGGTSAAALLPLIQPRSALQTATRFAAVPSQGRKDTVYTVRLSTGLQRGAALTDPTGGVLVVRGFD